MAVYNLRLGAASELAAPKRFRLRYSWAKASRSCFSCSSGRLVEMISKSYCFNSSTTLSTAVAPLVRAKSAEVPSVTLSRTCLTKSSWMPTSARAPVIPPMPAPIAAPRNGTKKIRPNRKPQNAPLIAPAPAVLCSWRVVGFLLRWGQLTTAASSSVISCRSCMPCRAMSTLSAPLGSSNFSTDSVATRASPHCLPLLMRCVPCEQHPKERTSLGCRPRSLLGSCEPALLALDILGHVGERPQALPQRDRPAGEEDRQRPTDQEESQ